MTPVIAVGLDGSAESRAAARWAANEAVRRGLGVHLVHAWLWQPLDVPIVQNRDTEAQRAEDVLREAADELTALHPDLTVTSEVVPDATLPALLHAAERAELLALGTKGYGAVLGFLLGSYGQQVIAEATRPVVSVRAAAGQEAGNESGPVVVGQQGGAEDSHDVLGFAFAAASARGVGVRAVRAWSLPPLYAYSPGSLYLADQAGGLEPFEKAALHEALEPWIAKYPDVPVEEHVEMGTGGQVLLSTASDAGLVVVGRRARKSAIGTRIGSVAHAVLHHAPCPVAVVPHA
ncbi:universal stress protein [Streptomyces bambusae]|nr:universal stress protein [Streptomyces bambusae]MCB5163880.1 universal stress protein [Streptomyces bambusae]